MNTDALLLTALAMRSRRGGRRIPDTRIGQPTSAQLAARERADWNAQVERKKAEKRERKSK